MALTETRPETEVVAAAPADGSVPRSQPTAAERFLGTGDHRTIGRVYIGAALLFLASDLVIAALVNFHAAEGILEDSVANRFWLNHPISLLLCGVMPLVLGLGIHLVPLQLGSPTIAFPRAAAASLWGFLGGTLLHTIAILIKGSYGGSSESLTQLGHVAVGLIALSLLVGALTVVTTVFSHRPAGMSISRVPFFSFAWLVTGALWFTTLPVLLAVIAIGHIRHLLPTEYEATLYPTISWIFGQPALYIAAIPLLGILADTASVAGGERQRSYTAVQGLIVAFGALSFGAWAQSDAARETLVWAVAAVLIAIPVLAVLGGSLDTVRRGTPKATAGFALAVVAALLLLLAIASGAVIGVSTAGDGELFTIGVGGFAAGAGAGLAVGQFYLVIAAVLVGGLAGVFAWSSRMFRGGLPAGAGLGLAPLALLGGLAFGGGHVVAGLATPDQDATEVLAIVSGVGAVLLSAVAVLGLGLVIGGAVANGKGDPIPAGADDDAPEAVGGTLEWLTASPPVTGNFAEPLPAIESEYPLFDLTDSGAN